MVPVTLKARIEDRIANAERELAKHKDDPLGRQFYHGCIAALKEVLAFIG